MPVMFKNATKKIIHAHVVDQIEEVPAIENQGLDARIKAKNIEFVPMAQLKPNPRNAKKHPDHQVALIAENFEGLGVIQPIVIDENGMIICGHGRFEAGKKIGLTHLPAIRLSGLTSAQKRALALADNKLAELGDWDLDMLSEELSFLHDPLTELDFDPRMVGFETVEIDKIIGEKRDDDRADPADELPPLNSPESAVTNLGDLWICDQHSLVCGDATDKGAYADVM